MAVRRSYLNIYNDGRHRLENNSPITNFNSQGTAKAFLDILALEGERLYDNLEYIYNSIDPTKAVGSDLDKLAFMVGISRNTAVVPTDYSNTNFYFYIDSRLNWDVNTLITSNYTYDERLMLQTNGFITMAGGAVTNLKIPLDHVIKNSNSNITYTTIEDANISSKEAYVGIIGTQPGETFNVQTNALINHSLIEIPELRRIANFIKCTNRFPITNGKYSTTDDELRYNISIARSVIRTNELSIRNAALQVPGVRDILFERNKFGNGTVSIIVDGISPIISQGLINAVKEKIQQELSYGDVIFVNAPNFLGVSLSVNIVVTPGADILSLKNTYRDLIIQYINDLPIGGEIVWNKIISLGLSVQDVIDVVPNYFKYGEYDTFNKLNRKEIALRFINQKADYNQKFYTDTGLCSVCSE